MDACGELYKPLVQKHKVELEHEFIMDKKNGRGGVLPPHFRRPANTSALVANIV